MPSLYRVIRGNMAATEKRLDILSHATVVDAESRGWFQETGKKGRSRRLKSSVSQSFIKAILF